MTLDITTRLWLPLLFLTLLMTGEVLGQQEPSPEKGNKYPDFHLTRLDGSTGTLSNYRGQKIILFQFASW